MKEYNVDVLFKDGYILNMPKELVSNDFNSTKLNLTFDIEGRVFFKMLFPDKETFIVDEVKDNTIIFKEGYLSQEGIYLIEFAIYDETRRLTNNAISEIPVRRELVSTNDIVEIDDRVPILDGLIRDVNEAIEKVSNIESGDGTGTGSINYTLPIASANTLGGIKVGANLTIEPDGTLNAAVSSSEGETKNENIEPLSDDIPKVFINGSIPTDKTELEAELTYMSKTEEFHSYIKIKCQGNSSMSYPKKNFTIKLYSDEERSTKLKKNFKGWGKESKFCLKANYIDHSHARNIISANLWADVVKSRSNYDSLPEELRTSPNNGAIDGFPIKVYNNGTYQGLYTWNIPKDGWMTNMDDELDTHSILCSENYHSGCFRATANIDGNDWTDELHDTVPATIKTSFNNAINHVMNSTDAEFKANLSNYFDVPSLIDYYIFQYVICGLDSMGKNQLYLTYDGTHWIASSYDMDSTFGLYWNGSRFVSTEYRMQEDYESMLNGYSGNLLYQRLEENFVDEIKERYNELRVNVLNYSNMFSKFERFVDSIGKDLYDEDVTIYTGIPSPTTNNITQIRNYIRDRLTYVDTEISKLNIPIPCTSITLNANTLELTSTDTKTLIATVEPSDTTDTIIWESNDTTVAKVNNGVVTPLKNGNCIITATCGSQSATCNVVITGISEEDEPVEDENILVSNYVADGTGFVYTNNINFENQYIEASIDLSNVQKGNVNILDIGENIPDWNTTTNMHCYYSTGNSYIKTYLVFDGADHSWDIPIPSTKFKIKLSNEGLFIDNVLYEPTGWQPLYVESIEKLLALTTIQIGSKEGSKLSTATYEYIKIGNNDVTNDVVEEVIVENYSPNGEAFTYTVNNFNGETDFFETSVDLSTCKNEAENILSIGKNIGLWGGYNLHCYYYNDSKYLQINFANNIGYARTTKDLSDNNLKIKLNNVGLYINDELITNWTSDVANQDLATEIKDYITSLTTIQIGSQEGNVRSNATYNYIKVIRNS